MLVLKTTSPSTSPRAPKARPVKIVPSSSASLAESMGVVGVRVSFSWESSRPQSRQYSSGQYTGSSSVAARSAPEPIAQANRPAPRGHRQGRHVERHGHDGKG